MVSFLNLITHLCCVTDIPPRGIPPKAQPTTKDTPPPNTPQRDLVEQFWPSDRNSHQPAPKHLHCRTFALFTFLVAFFSGRWIKQSTGRLLLPPQALEQWPQSSGTQATVWFVDTGVRSGYLALRQKCVLLAFIIFSLCLLIFCFLLFLPLLL